MNVLVACEESQRVAMSIRDKGHYAFSCDVTVLGWASRISYTRRCIGNFEWR